MTNLPSTICSIRWMVWDTYKQAMSSYLLWLMLGLTFLSVILCLSISIHFVQDTSYHPFALPLYLPAQEDSEEVRAEGIRVVSGEISIGFGLLRFPVGRSRTDAVHWFQVWLAGLVADTVGILLTLLWTSAFIPQFLEPHSISVLLAKPNPRWSLLVGKYLGVVIFVGIQAAFFVCSTWLALGVQTGIWDARYWLAVPLLILNFSVFYAFSVMLAVSSRGVVVPLFGTLLFWIMCWGMNWARHHLVSTDISGLTPVTYLLVETGYWLMPKPLDFSGLFYEFMDASSVAAPVPEWESARQKGCINAELSVFSSLTFGIVALFLAVLEFYRKDY